MLFAVKHILFQIKHQNDKNVFMLILCSINKMLTH